ncbi:hypothetical protein CVT26_011005 [Gymnopilus dilepis]|uniref:Uncharacterized protein n=1 Tax=Gymnopilus dilepis TaxID=231916 RepID=A0A409VY99_9AGAR|nr:hypothetical protein CVT26_011005 [Gymnopilus dilepis]
MSGELEGKFMEQQRRCLNLTSYKVYPLPSKLEEIPYPLDIRGYPILPEHLTAHSRTHDFNMPSCFHGDESLLVLREGRVVLVCGTAYGDRCGFFVDLYDILYKGFEFKFSCARYCLRLGSPISSDSIESSDSLPSLMSISDSEDRSKPKAGTFVGGSYHVRGGAAADGDGSDVLNTPSSSDTSAVGPRFLVPSASDSIMSPDDRWAPVKLNGNDGHLDLTVARVASGDGIGIVNGWASVKDGALFKPFRASDLNAEVNGLLNPCLSSRSGQSEEISLKGVLDEDVYPLLARAAGSSPLTSCIDPATCEFDNDQFLSQIIKDFRRGGVNY